MKVKYPDYKKGDLDIIEDKLSSKNKKILDDFITYCSTSAGIGKAQKIRKLIVQFWDVTEIDLDKHNKDSINSFLAVLNGSNRSTPTKNETKTYLKKFIKWKYRDLKNVDLEDMYRNLKHTSFDVNPQKINESAYATDQDVEKMLRFAEGYRDKALVFTEYESGGRPQEILNLTWGDVKFEDDIAMLTFYSGKTKKTRSFPVKKAKQFLWDWKQNYCYDNLTNKDFVFPSRFGRNKPMSSANANKILRKMADKAGIKKDFWNYLFRHTRANQLYENLPTPMVEQLMGHKDMYRTYAGITNKKAREELIKRIYNIENLSPEQKAEYEIRIKKLEEITGELLKLNKEQISVRKKLFPLLNIPHKGSS